MFRREWSIKNCVESLVVAGAVCLTGCHSQSFGLGRVLAKVSSAVRGSDAVHADTTVAEKQEAGPTEIVIGQDAIQTGVKRLGINLGEQNFYDSGQMLRDLTFNNPGFEGEQWESILRCAGMSQTTCTDPDQWNQWPEDFLAGGTFEAISGAAAGVGGTILGSSKAEPDEQDQGVTLRFAPLERMPDTGDFVVVKKEIPGDAQQGWWTTTYGGALLATEFKDLPPGGLNQQALRISALLPGQDATVSSYFDSTAGRSFVQMKGRYRVFFRAKALLGNGQMTVTVRRQTVPAAEVFLSRVVTLTPEWKDYEFDFSADEDGQKVGTAGLTFDVHGADVLLDDAGVTAVGGEDNPTAFRDAVVTTLEQLKPGILRGRQMAGSLDDMLAPPVARQRVGWSEGASSAGTVPMGLGEFLELCKTVGAEPWVTLPGAFSPEEMRELVEYLAGPQTTAYGSKRALVGQMQPWTAAFPVIHLELGNEEWNGPTFAGEAMPNPTAYGQRVKQVFGAARSAPFFEAGKFDLVMGSFALIPGWTKTELMASGGANDSVAVAPYLFDAMDDASTDEAVFGPMLAEPEMIDSRSNGYMAEQAAVARGAGRPSRLSVYEVNLGTASGSASQAAFDRAVPSMGAGLAVVDHMLLMLRDLGVKDQMVWALTGYDNVFTNSVTHQRETTPLFGTVVDMGGETNLRRPQFLAEQMANEAILPTMLRTSIRGSDPVWQQAKSANNGIALRDAHDLQTFAFADGDERSLIVLNLARTQALPVRFAGVDAPSGVVTVSRLSAAHITDNNEAKAEVVPVVSKVVGFEPGKDFVLPPFSMTVLRWVVKR